MQSAFFFFAAAIASVNALPSPQVTGTASNGTIAVGGACSSKADCAGGADCYASNYMLQPKCGNSQASCTYDSQCAYNPCSEGVCAGFLPTTSSATTVPTATFAVNEAASTTDACASACASAYSTCRTKPDASRPLCAASYAECLGYSLYGSNGSLVTPTACSTTSSATATA